MAAHVGSRGLRVIVGTSVQRSAISILLVAAVIAGCASAPVYTSSSTAAEQTLKKIEEEVRTTDESIKSELVNLGVVFNEDKAPESVR